MSSKNDPRKNFGAKLGYVLTLTIISVAVIAVIKTNGKRGELL